MDPRGIQIEKEVCVDLNKQLIESVKVLFSTQYKNKTQKLGYCKNPTTL